MKAGRMGFQSTQESLNDTHLSPLREHGPTGDSWALAALSSFVLTICGPFLCIFTLFYLFWS